MLPLTADADPVVAHLATHALVQLRASEVCLKAFDSPGSASLQPGAARVLEALHEPAVVEGVTARLHAASDSAARRLLLGALVRLYNREADWDGKWWGIRPVRPGRTTSP